MKTNLSGEVWPQPALLDGHGRLSDRRTGGGLGLVWRKTGEVRNARQNFR